MRRVVDWPPRRSAPARDGRYRECPRAQVRSYDMPATRPPAVAQTISLTPLGRSDLGREGFTGNAHRAQVRSYVLTGAPAPRRAGPACRPAGGANAKTRRRKPATGPNLQSIAGRWPFSGAPIAQRSTYSPPAALPARRRHHIAAPEKRQSIQRLDYFLFGQTPSPAPSQSTKSTRRNPGAAFWHTACISSGETADSHTAAGRDAALGRTNGTGTS